ncbi:MAG: transglutaminase domain-containing protein [Euryarchaeota archaeon]|nr:transglutaminase domain-containing protein [Euryarchaeota archaeon]
MRSKVRPEPHKFKGRTGFGIYDELLSPENCLHAQGTVDSVLLDEMLKLVPETAEYIYGRYTPLTIKCRGGERPYLENIVRNAIRKTDRASRAMDLTSFCSNIPSEFPEPGKSTNNGFWTTDTMLFGGTEEELIKRGTDICIELSRVLCILAQIAGMPARLVFLFDQSRRNWGHGVTEIYLRTPHHPGWAVFDATSNVCYPLPEGGFASAWDLRTRPEIADGHPDHDNKPYVASAFYECAAVVNYFAWEWKRYDYSWNSINDYYRRIWEKKD